MFKIQYFNKKYLKTFLMSFFLKKIGNKRIQKIFFRFLSSFEVNHDNNIPNMRDFYQKTSI